MGIGELAYSLPTLKCVSQMWFVSDLNTYITQKNAILSIQNIFKHFNIVFGKNTFMGRIVLFLSILKYNQLHGTNSFQKEHCDLKKPLFIELKRGSVVVKALYYKPESRGFDTR
jgi:hypothetical protein